MTMPSRANERDESLAECFPPGEFVKDELEARGITVAAFGAAMGMSERNAAEFLAGRRRCSVAETEKLARMFDTSPMLWLNLQKAWTDRANAKGAKRK